MIAFTFANISRAIRSECLNRLPRDNSYAKTIGGICRKQFGYMTQSQADQHPHAKTPRIHGICWIGYGTGNSEEARNFFGNILGLEASTADRDMFKLDEELFLEAIGPDSPYAEYMKRPIVAFKVHDAATAKEAFEAKGIEFITDVLTNDGYDFALFKGPDDNLFELVSPHYVG
ncbi:VOC family protein [Pseudodesulfovibrio sp. zrk46]|uniref:VOC family protein n=1 Tax=Pseudodesulfovibrio sp. zrk46 TaxID=2725288 RepID=UPI001448B995|nr:VOC family protein [Pseudodesulfovibrio sp. zrk46]QJB56838.1 VOC family protein [Pseudodesulfovibrio sp. zrk46]